MIRTLSLSSLVLSTLLLVACDDKPPAPAAGSSKPSATAAASGSTKTAASPTASAAASASAAPKAGFTCPDGSTGEGTGEKPCKATGQQRAIEVKWTGKYDDKGLPLFSMKNLTAFDTAGGDSRVWFYDAAGKQLDTATFDKKSTQRYWWASGGMFQSGNPKANESQDSTPFGGLDAHQVPKGTVNIEAEIWGVGFKAPEGTPPYRWENTDLKGEERPQAGKAPDGAQPAPGK